MQGIPRQLRVATIFNVDGLKGKQSPTSLGYNDMVVMIAFGYSDEYGTPTVSATMISEYLKKDPAVPADSRMEPSAVQSYLDELFSNRLLERNKKTHQLIECVMM